jgi:hypothetical protein
MAKNSDWGSGKEIQDIMEKFVEKFPGMFEGFDVNMIHFIITEKKKSRVPVKVHTAGHPVEVFAGRPYIVEAFDLWWKEMNQKQKNQAVFGVMTEFPPGAFDDTSKYYGKKLQPDIKMSMIAYAAFGGVPNWYENPLAKDPMERDADEIAEDVPVVEAIPEDGVPRVPVTSDGIGDAIPNPAEADAVPA